MRLFLLSHVIGPLITEGGILPGPFRDISSRIARPSHISTTEDMNLSTQIRCSFLRILFCYIVSKVKTMCLKDSFIVVSIPNKCDYISKIPPRIRGMVYLADGQLLFSKRPVWSLRCHEKKSSISTVQLNVQGD